MPAAPAAPPQRVVAASVFSAEVLCAIAPRQRLAGVHYLAADPLFSLVVDEAASLPLVGAEPEQLLAVRPDLVVLDAYTSSSTATLLQRAGVRVERTGDAHDFAGVAANVRELAHWCDLDRAGEALVEAMNRDLAQLALRAPDVRAFRVMTLAAGLHTYGHGSLFDAVIEAVGAVNIAAEHGVEGFRVLDVETVLTWRPDVLIVGVPPGAEHEERDRLRQYPGFDLLPCMRRDRLLFVPMALHGTTSHHVVRLAQFVQDRLREWGSP